VEELFTFHYLIALLTLTLLEIVLGIDNIVFIAILSAKLKPEQRNRGRRIGLAGAMIMRILLLLSISWIMTLNEPLITIGKAISGKDLILIVGGVFLIFKATHEIHQKLEGADHQQSTNTKPATLQSVVMQIMVMDLVFSIDSVITAVGMVDPSHVPAAGAHGDAVGSAATVPATMAAVAGGIHWQPLTVMITAVVIAVAVMMLFARPISEFVDRHPTIKMLALSFLMLIGVMLVAEGFGQHIDKGYIYFAMAFSLVVELLNLRMKRRSKPVHLHQKLPN